MQTVMIPIAEIDVDPALARVRIPRVFEDRLRASILAIGLVEPIKVARSDEGRYVVLDGVLRLNAFRELEAESPERFGTIQALLYEYSRRFEVRFQSDIYQDLLPSQLARLVEHLHAESNIPKHDIARYLGVSPATLRNYTGLWRMVERGGSFQLVVDLMDLNVVPSSNPYAWLRLTEDGVRASLTRLIDADSEHELCLTGLLEDARRSTARRFSLKDVERVTSTLPSHCYREDDEVRKTKKRLGQRRATRFVSEADPATLRLSLESLAAQSESPVLRTALESLVEALS